MSLASGTPICAWPLGLRYAPHSCGAGRSERKSRETAGLTGLLGHVCCILGLLWKVDAGNGRRCNCRLVRWLTELGDKRAGALNSCMDLMARGIVVPTVGVLPENIVRES